MIRTALAFIFLLLAVPLGALIAVPWSLLAGNVNFLYALGMRIARAAVRLAGVRVVIRGVENLDPAQTLEALRAALEKLTACMEEVSRDVKQLKTLPAEVIR